MFYLPLFREQEINRITVSSKPGTFKKGASGNPKGRPKVFAEVQELARKKTTANIARIERLAEFAEDDNVKLRASIALHEIAWGKPIQQVKQEGDLTLHAGDSLSEMMLKVRQQQNISA